jgi:hypothetical protein
MEKQKVYLIISKVSPDSSNEWDVHLHIFKQ